MTFKRKTAVRFLCSFFAIVFLLGSYPYTVFADKDDEESEVSSILGDDDNDDDNSEESETADDSDDEKKPQE